MRETLFNIVVLWSLFRFGLHMVSGLGMLNALNVDRYPRLWWVSVVGCLSGPLLGGLYRVPYPTLLRFLV